MAISDFIGLIGVIIGGGISVASQWFPHWWEQRRARASARALALAYIDGVIQMEKRRGHGERAQLVIEFLKAKEPVTLPKIYGADIYPNTNAIRKLVIERLGLLQPNDAKDMVRFLNMGDGLDADVVAMSTGKMDNLLLGQKIFILEEDVKLREEMMQLGRELVRRLGQSKSRNHTTGEDGNKGAGGTEK